MSKDLKDVDYDEIKKLIKTSIRHVPVAIARLHKNALVDRVRVNSGDTLFMYKKDISYISDEAVIQEVLTGFGRANRPRQVMFYGALESTEIPQQRATAIFETSKILRDKDAIDVEGELVTVSRWRVMEELFIVEIVFSDEAIAQNPDTRRSFEFQLARILNHPFRELGLRQIQFFSKEFAKQIINNWDYKISAAYTDLVLNDHKLVIEGKQVSGIAYPSVPSSYKGQNIVLKPEVVDKYLRLEVVSTHRIHKNGMKSLINNHKFVKNLNSGSTKFSWVDVDAEYVVPLDVVKRDHLEL